MHSETQLALGRDPGVGNVVKKNNDHLDAIRDEKILQYFNSFRFNFNVFVWVPQRFK